MRIREETALTFDDVLMVPQYSEITSRNAVHTRTRITPKIECDIPIISSNMDTVTEANMAIAMARAGGLGILHRFLTPERNAQEVIRVKRAESYVVAEPVTVKADVSVTQAADLMLMKEVSALLVVDDQGRLDGILTRRDIELVEELKGAVSDFMTPREGMAVGQPGISLEEARAKLYERRVEKLPLVDDQGKLQGLITASDILKQKRNPRANKDDRGRLCVGAAVGVKPEDIERAGLCLEAGADLLVVDIAHGSSSLAVDMVKLLKKNFPDCEVMAGNVAASTGVRALADAGADSIKVGVGSGSICTTRIVTGAGFPQLSALMDCYRVAQELGVSLISDGGIRNSGDITKALGAGADAVMLGSLLAGTTESPGAEVVRDGRRFKVVRGMASLSANMGRKSIDGGEALDTDWERVVPEGVEAVVPYRGPVRDVLHLLVGGLRSGLTYSGAESLAELRDKAEYVRITGAGMAESRHHDVDKLS